TEITLNDGNTFSKNTSNNHGGAVCLSGSTMTATGNNTFSENSATKHGGAIYVTYTENEDETDNPGVLTMTDGKFTANSAMGGGAVSIRTGCEASFDGTVFDSNSVEGFDGEEEKDNNGNGEGGGAIYVGYGTLNLDNVTLTDNIASGFGGAIDSVKSTVTITNGTFSGNEALYGGAIYAFENSGVTINGTTFTANKSTFVTDYDGSKGGGAISIKGGTLTVTEATFDGNISDYYGGAILANGTTVVIDGNTVIKNSVGKTGSALHFRGVSKVTMTDVRLVDNKDAANGVIYVNTGTLDMTNVTASGNSASSGGVMFISGASTKVTVDKCSFTSNSAKTGGAVSLTNGTLVITESEFTKNTANLGGVVYNEKGSLTVSDSSFTENSATKTSTGSRGNGGAIVVAGGTLTASGNTFTSNTAENNSGAVYVTYFTDDNGTVTNSTANITGGTFEKNSAATGGAISISTGCSVNLDGTSFIENSASTAGAVNVGEGGMLTLSNTTFNANSATGNGGAIYARNAEITLNSGNTFSNNTSAGNGGAISLAGTKMTANGDNKFIGNSATKHAGAIYVSYSENADKTKNPGVLTMTGGTFSENSAMGGGAVSIRTSCEASFDGTVFTDNISEGNDGVDDGDGEGGGAIYVGYGKLTLKDVTATGNTSSDFGGAVNVVGASTIPATLDITGGEFKSNTATTGGVLHVMGTGTVVTVSDSAVFESNKATKGGAFYINKNAVVNVSNSSFNKNSSTGGDGGAILIADTTANGTYKTTLNLTSVTFTGNTAYAKGGALSTDITSRNLVINAENCTFKENASGKDNESRAGGGAVEIQNGNCPGTADPAEITIVFKNCNFEGNSATSTGGAIEIRTNSCIKIDGITATNNVASQNGGVVYVTSNHSRLYLTGDVTLSGNTASKGTFAYLYHTSTYNNPPRIYTTHSNTASWVSQVASYDNTVRITYDLTEMP
ncbi:MAG: hypothetical protein IKK10_03600, partial [Clostridia bacterium]|nr:hypothetical protein [Clostridia bacterium]